MIAPILVVQHEDQCPPAWYGDWLVQAGVPVDVRRPFHDDPLPGSLTDHAGMLVLGGSMGAYDDALCPWLATVKTLVREAASSGVPVLGLCLGHQLAAVALGGRVEVNPRGQQLGLIDVGWLPASRDDALFAAAGQPRRGVQFNDDIVVQLPPGAVALAQTQAGELQAARLAPTVWGVQLHPEADDQVVAPWAAADRPRHPEGVVDAAMAEITAARDELAAAWRPLATAFASLARARHTAETRMRDSDAHGQTGRLRPPGAGGA